MPEYFRKETTVVASLCRAAARLAMAHYSPDIEVVYKSGDARSPVTQADKDANACIVAGLQEHFADDGICAEELEASHAFDSRKDKRRLWCIDPIDGTREFIAQSGQFAVMVGLAIDGEARFGMVYEPTIDALYCGGIGDDGSLFAFVEQNGVTKPLQTSDAYKLAGARLMVSRWHVRNRIIEAVNGHLGSLVCMPLGSVGLKVARLCQAQAELYVCATNKIHEWDACGPEAILRGAGGKVTDLGGRKLTYNKPFTHMAHGLVASNGHLHVAALQAIAAAQMQVPTLACLMPPAEKV